jgi:hypothetical protein
MTQTINLICNSCKNWENFKGCPAFPDGIPDEILIKNKHSKVIKEQIGKFIFEPINENTYNSSLKV